LTSLEHCTNWKIANWMRDMELRTELKARGQKFKPQGSLWVYMSQRQWREELIDLFSEKKIAKALFELELLGLVKSRPNPWDKRDKRRQYLLRVVAVQKRLDFLCGIRRDAYRHLTEWTAPNGGVHPYK